MKSTSFVEIALTWIYWTVGLAILTFLLLMWTVNPALNFFSWILLTVVAALSLFSVGFLAVTKYNNPKADTTSLVFALFLFRFMVLIFFIGLYLIFNKEELGRLCLVPIFVYFTVYTIFDIKHLNKYSEYLDKKFK